MSDLQRRRRCWHTHPKKLCIQTWNESGISGAGFAKTMARVYDHYFKHIPKGLYDDEPTVVDAAAPPAPAPVGEPSSLAVGAGAHSALLPPIATTTSPNYEPCYALFLSSLEQSGE